ncbi:DUF2218 domain-containing protein [Rhodospirillum sp. A1_3_36]|uniref:DUF2218 domain-containing protein n=1 Tax=Rhodospirillum sp. A1_3_36 TaxID=3391666 RepID=UPI0039A61CC6
MSGLRVDRLRKRFGLPPLPPLSPMTDLEPDEELSPMAMSTARVPTPNGSRYLQQLCKHWSHNLSVEFTPEAGTVAFPKDGHGANWPGDALLTLEAEEAHLLCTLTGSVSEQVEALKDVVSRHLDRFAFREAPLAFDWVDG